MSGADQTPPSGPDSVLLLLQAEEIAISSWCRRLRAAMRGGDEAQGLRAVAAIVERLLATEAQLHAALNTASHAAAVVVVERILREAATPLAAAKRFLPGTEALLAAVLQRSTGGTPA